MLFITMFQSLDGHSKAMSDLPLKHSNAATSHLLRLLQVEQLILHSSDLVARSQIN